ncbi:MAG: DNA repair protein RecN [Bacteroidetes bacterium]|nr:DNA repair protein RecN [Bacteroidota bacterium]MDA1122545.1 DNA repair protein RecN [Bacteroidota bacterium]
MLKSLSIKNYALIQQLEIQPAAQLNIITGETGAGKSIMLGAVGLLLGNRVDTKTLLDKQQKCIIEATFDISTYHKLESLFQNEALDYDHETIIRREIIPSGKSRAFVNDTPVRLDILKDIGVHLMDVHSQNDSLDLGSTKFQLELTDLYSQSQSELMSYQSAYLLYKQKQSELEKLQDTAIKIKEELDYNSFLLKELDQAGLDLLDQKQLEEDLKIQSNSEEIKLKLNELLQQLSDSENDILTNINKAVSNLTKLASFSELYSKIADRLESCQIELKDITNEIHVLESAIEHDPGKIEELKIALNEVYRLQQKHRVDSIDELIGIQQDLIKKVDQAQNIDNSIVDLEGEVRNNFKIVMDQGLKLRKKRLLHLESLQSQLRSLLINVGINDATALIQHNEVNPNGMGIDNIEILFSANKGVPPKPIKEVASGGEFSRLMFCIKYILADKTQLPTIIFDEIDTGISGEIALKMAKMMKQMAESHQVIAISHLPQFAAQGDAHYYVYKDVGAQRSISKIKRLEGSDRITEIAKMIGGETPSDAALENARELMNI